MALTVTAKYQLCWSLFFIVFTNSITSASKLPSICESKCTKGVNATETEKYCNKHPDLKIQQRCCVNPSTSTILGIDLQDCKLTRELFANGIANLSHLVIISLEGNPIKEIEGTDFNNNTQIKYLDNKYKEHSGIFNYIIVLLLVIGQHLGLAMTLFNRVNPVDVLIVKSLPPTLHCPGRNYSWGDEEYNSTSRSVCLDELDPCSAPRNYTCPDNSYCKQFGVNTTDCFCKKGYHGYKCLNEGEFPFLEFGLGISIPSVILCIFLWITQRRHVKTRPKTT